MMLCLWGKYTANKVYGTCAQCGGTRQLCTISCPCGATNSAYARYPRPTSMREYCLTCSATLSYSNIRSCNFCNGTGTIETGNYSPSTYLSTVTAEANTYPQNGRHSDGFWYVYAGLANATPTISGTDTDLGEVTELLHKYSINDTDPSDVITVIERLDGVQLRTFTATREVEYTINPVWIEVLNGVHSLTITATDNVGASTVRTISFSKAEHELEFTLQTPLAADDLVTKTIMSVTRELPPGALMQIYVCNNGYDEAPTWEDITSQVLTAGKFFFANTVKTADKWGYNLRICVQRLGAEGDCFVSSAGGNYE